jgi:hypothetical protein
MLFLFQDHATDEPMERGNHRSPIGSNLARLVLHRHTIVRWFDIREVVMNTLCESSRRGLRQVADAAAVY